MRREREDYLKFNERCQENANYKKLQPDSLHSLDGWNQKGRQTISINEEMQKVESTGDEVKLYSCFGKQSGSPSISHLWTNNSLPRYIPEKTEHMRSHKNMHTCSQQHYPFIAKEQKPPKCPSANERINKTWYIHTTEYYSVKRGKDVDTCYNRDEPWKHYAS